MEIAKLKKQEETEFKKAGHKNYKEMAEANYDVNYLNLIF